MANQLAVALRAVGSGFLQDLVTGARQNATPGGVVLPAINWVLATGTGDLQADQWYLARRTLAAGATDLLDLSGGLTNALSQTLTVTALKLCWVFVVDPDGIKKIRVGPQGQANPIQMGFGGTGATAYADVFEDQCWKNRYSGWTVAAGTGDVLPVKNPGADELDYVVWLVGK